VNKTLSLFPDSATPTRLAVPDAELLYYESVDFRVDSKLLMKTVVEETHWRSDPITLFGKTFMQPRLMAWHGDPGASYSYSGINNAPEPWTALLRKLKKHVEALAEAEFNSVLLNYYRDQNDSMGLHADDEPELGARPVIASLSLGDVRTLYFSHRTDKHIANVRLPLADSSLLIMKGCTQEYWKHGIRKQKRPRGPRLNLTFRQIIKQ
jgi:alkylated DNA repair dioxygenase AlkB